jgi:hypothetical protein
MLNVMTGKLMFVNVRRRHHQIKFQRNSVSIRRGMPNETVWGMSKKTVALYPGGVYRHFRSVCNLVDTVCRRIDTGSQSMVDSACVSYSWGHFIQLYGFMYESALC